MIFSSLPSPAAKISFVRHPTTVFDSSMAIRRHLIAPDGIAPGVRAPKLHAKSFGMHMERKRESGESENCNGKNRKATTKKFGCGFFPSKGEF